MFTKETLNAPWNIYLTDPIPSDPVAQFTTHVEEIRQFLKGISASKALFRYAPGKWSVCEVVGHIADADLIFMVRMLCIARGEIKPLPGFEEDDYVKSANFEKQSWDAILAAHKGIAETATALILGFDKEAWQRRGTVNQFSVSPLEMLWVWMGHERHHIKVLKERYGLG